MPLYSLCELAADLLIPNRLELGLKPAKELVSKKPTGFVFGKHRWRYLRKSENEDGHILVIGGTGSGKTTSIGIPSGWGWRQRMFAIDIDGELTEKVSPTRPTLKIFDPYNPASFGYDPFFLLSRSNNLVADIREVVSTIIPRPPELREPFWVDGARNLLAGALLHILTMPVIIRELDDASAVLVMVDSNLEQRESLLPSEKAWAYKMMMDALNHNGVKGENHSFEIMVERTRESKNQIFRVIRLTGLIVTLADKVNAKLLAFNPAAELSYLSLTEQTAVVEAMAAHEVKPSLSQAVRLKNLNKAGKLTLQTV